MRLILIFFHLNITKDLTPIDWSYDIFKSRKRKIPYNTIKPIYMLAGYY